MTEALAERMRRRTMPTSTRPRPVARALAAVALAAGPVLAMSHPGHATPAGVSGTAHLHLAADLAGPLAWSLLPAAAIVAVSIAIAVRHRRVRG